MKTLPTEEKERIREGREQLRRSRIADDIARTDRKFRRLEHFILGGFLFVGLVLAGWLVIDIRSQNDQVRKRYRPETYSAFTNLVNMASVIESEHHAALDRLDLDILRNYALIERTQDYRPFKGELAKARGIISFSREETRMLFRRLNALFPPESTNERHDAQKTYGELMTEFDVSEARIDADEQIILLLEKHRGKWHVKHGKVEFDDSALQVEFNSLLPTPDESTARWRKDFGSIESNVVELPSPPVSK